jgi:transcriptional regulator with XRE-family HTH domain
MIRENTNKKISTPGDRIKTIRGLLKITAEAMAEKLDISRAYLSKLENNKADAGPKLLKVMEAQPGINTCYVTDSVEPFFLTEIGKQIAKNNAPPGHLEKSKSSPPPGYIEDANRVESNHKPWPQDYAESNSQPYGIPVFDLGVSAGMGHGMQPGLQALDASIEVYFTPAYMRRHFGRSGNGFAMVYVKGDSMQPTLWDGDEIVVDTRVQRVDRDGIYVFMLRGDIKVKRMQVKLDGSLLVKSDNGAYETEHVGAGQADTFQVQGRLVWPRLR